MTEEEKKIKDYDTKNKNKANINFVNLSDKEREI
jgi:hypothetical protein